MEHTQKEGPELSAPATDEVPSGRKSSFWRRGPVIVIGTVLLGLALFAGLGYLAETFTHESTDDAFVDADTVSVAPRVAGQIEKVYVIANQAVKAGEPLVELDPRDLAVALEEKRAALESAKANVEVLKAVVELGRAQISSSEATAKQSVAEASASAAKADKAKADLKRAQDLIQSRTISPQEFDAAQAAAVAAEADLKAAQEKAASNQAKVNEILAQLQAAIKAFERGQAQTRQAAVEVQAAELNLSYTKLFAPEDAYVTKKAAEVGNYVQVGQSLMALVPAKGLYVTANFKETQLLRIRPGQRVKLMIDSVAKGPFSGYVESLQAGSGAAFSLLPPENAVGNYVKVVQRVPVRIFFDQPVEAGHVLGPGMSVVPSVHVTGYEVPEAGVLILAAILALVPGAFWWRAAARR